MANPGKGGKFKDEKDGSHLDNPLMSSCRYFRPLGSLETSTHLFTQQGTDIILQSYDVLSTQNIHRTNISAALLALSRRHPLLRACILEDKQVYNRFHFLEMTEPSIDFEILHQDYDEKIRAEVTRPFNFEKGPMAISIHQSF